ncbi:MAG TPA: S-methyl-5-thioribose-1-phosphate isomerase [Phycisphaerae bacterium]|nr:S-methyl-5-thioribose-1-phosphate isomerase [Phycisphaerae bacterium]
MSASDVPRTIEWIGDLDGHVALIDQTLLPNELKIIECRDTDSIREAICSLRVRGAPAIGIAGAMGVVLGMRDADDRDRQGFLCRLTTVCDELVRARPTAVNLSWAIERMMRCADWTPGMVRDLKEALLKEAKAIRDEDAAMCRAIGQTGESLVPDGAGVLTHCNAGGLATAEYGTALAVLYAAHERGRSFRVYADETRPLLQGSRLTAWELDRAGIDTTVICDNMAGLLMSQGKIDLVITGADRIAANGDAANKIGTYSVAVLAQAHDIPFYVAAPTSTFDLSIPDGTAIPIEERSEDEIRHGFGRQTAPDGVPCYCPAFDVTPARLIWAIITNQGIIQPVNRERISALLAQNPSLPDSLESR